MEKIALRKLPIRRREKLPHRRTICVSDETQKILKRLEVESSVDIPELLRMAVDEFIQGIPIDEDK